MKDSRPFDNVNLYANPIERTIPHLPDTLYIQNRLDDQLQWHKRKSEINLRRYNLLKNIDTIIAALIPISLSIHTAMGGLGAQGYGVVGETLLKLLTAGAGVWLAISAGFFELEGLEHKSKEYEKLARQLETERYKYLTRTKPYDEDNAYSRLVMNIENLLHLDLMHFFEEDGKNDSKKELDELNQK